MSVHPAAGALVVTAAHLIALFPCIPFVIWSVRTVTHNPTSSTPACFIEAFGIHIFRLGLLHSLADLPLIFLRAFIHYSLPLGLSLSGWTITGSILLRAALGHFADSRRIQEQSSESKKTFRDAWQPLTRGISLSIIEAAIFYAVYCLMLSSPSVTAPSLLILIPLAFVGVVFAVLLSHSAYIQRVSYIVGDRNDTMTLATPSASLFPRLLVHTGMLMQQLAWVHALLALFSMPNSALALMIRLRL